MSPRQEATFQCPHCPPDHKKFLTAAALAGHIRFVHQDVAEDPLPPGESAGENPQGGDPEQKAPPPPDKPNSRALSTQRPMTAVSIPAVGSAARIESLIGDMKLPPFLTTVNDVDKMKIFFEGYNVGMQYALKNFTAAMRISQEYSDMAVKQAVPLINMYKTMVESNEASLKTEAAVNNWGDFMAQAFKELKDDISETKAQAKEAIGAAEQKGKRFNPGGQVEDMMARMMETQMNRVFNVMTGEGDKGKDSDYVPPGWTFREEGAPVKSGKGRR